MGQQLAGHTAMLEKACSAPWGPQSWSHFTSLTGHNNGRKQEGSGSASERRVPTALTSQPSLVSPPVLRLPSSALLSRRRNWCFFSMRVGALGVSLQRREMERCTVGYLCWFAPKWLILACFGFSFGACQSCVSMYLVKKFCRKWNLTLNSLTFENYIIKFAF